MYILVGMLKKIVLGAAALCVAFGHNRLLLNIRNALLGMVGLKIGKNAGIDRDFDYLPGGASISIGDESIIGIGNRFWNYDAIEVGRFCMFAAQVTLVNGSHDKNTFEPTSGKLRIGNGCWLGNGARVVGPITVGDNAVIAAGAVVLDDVPACAIVGGVPAKVLGYRELPDRVWHLGGRYFSPLTFKLRD